jgi:hypothetical protein
MKFTALRFTATGESPAAKRPRILSMTQHADNIWMKGSSYLYSQITGGVENAVPLHVDIPRTGGRGSDLPTNVFFRFFIHSRVTAGPYVISLLLSKHSTLMFCFLVY